MELSVLEPHKFSQKLRSHSIYLFIRDLATVPVKFNTRNDIKKRPLTAPTTLETLVGTVVMFSALPMLIFAGWHHRSLKFNFGRKGTQLFVGIWVLQGVSQLNVTRIVVVRKMDSAVPWTNSLRIQPFLLVPRRQGRFVWRKRP